MKKKIPGTHWETGHPGDLGKIIGRSIDSDDLGGNLGNFPDPGVKKLLLRRFSEREVMELLNYTGLIGHLNGAGFRNLHVDIGMDDSNVSCLRICDSGRGESDILVDIRLSERKFVPDREFFDSPKHETVYDMVIIEWLSAQNPLARDFDRGKPQLPGQTAPGLGVLRYLFDLLYLISQGIFNDGYLDVPDHIHGSIMYSRKFKFFDPAREAVLRALLRDLESHALSDISWGVITGAITDSATGEVLVYTPSHQVFPVSERIVKYFSSKKYHDIFMKIFREKRFRLDYETMVKKRGEILSRQGAGEL